MVVDFRADRMRGCMPEPTRWLARLLAIWDDQRAEAALPDADELFLADLAEVIPNLVLAYRDDLTDGFRIEFAGATAKAVLPIEPVGVIPEHELLQHPLAWLGAGFVRTRSPAVPGPQWMRCDDTLGLFLPYGSFDARVTLILVGIARWPAAKPTSRRTSTMVPLTPRRVRRCLE